MATSPRNMSACSASSPSAPFRPSPPYKRRPGAKKFGALNTAEKLNIIAEITAVPYRIMQAQADSPGDRSLLMGKGLADSQKK